MSHLKSLTLIEKACRDIQGFSQMYEKLEKKVTIGGYSRSTLNNYGRSIAKLSLYFGKSPHEIEDDQINDYLYVLAQSQTPSKSYFKHTVYGLRYLYRLLGEDDRAIRLPSLKERKTLPVVLSKQECRELFKAPRLLKHRVFLALIYSAGLRLNEVRLLRIEDIDSGRMQIRVRQGKGRKDRYVVLSELILRGLRKYYRACTPKVYLFNGREKGSPLGRRSVQWIIKQALKHTRITKQVSVHTLRHSFATHLLEDGVDLYTIKEQLGHARIETTLDYLHVARIQRRLAHSPMDTLYKK
jgi:site-specific recombinase XerD